MRFRRFIPQEKILDIQANEHQFYQDPDTNDKLDLNSTDILTNAPCHDHQSEEELDHEIENLQEILIQQQLEASVPPSLMELEIAMSTPPSGSFKNSHSLPEDAAVAIPHDDLPSPVDDPPQLERGTHPLSPNLIKVPPQPASPPPIDTGKHETPESDNTHTTLYN